MLVADFITYIEKEKRYSVHTVSNYERDLRSFEQFCQEDFACAIIEAQSKMVRYWFSSLMEQGMSSRSIRRKSSSLKSFYKYLLREGKIESSPAESVPLPKVPKKLPKYVEQKSMDVLLDEFDFEKGYKGEMERLVIELFYHTGIRLSELINLKVTSVNLREHQLKVVGKRNKERIVPFSNQLGETLGKFMAYRTSKNDYLFQTAKGEQAYPKLIYRIVNKYLDQVTTLSQKSPHVLRHTFATHMLNNGAELNAIKELLGHESLSATEVYTHNSLEKIKSVYKQAHPRA